MAYTGAPSFCQEVECARRVKARGLCGACYKRRRLANDLPPRLIPAPWTGECRRCGVIKGAVDFTPSMRRNGGWCKGCADEVRGGKYDSRTARDYHLKRKYGLSIADVLEMVVAQDGCAICHVRFPGYSGWCVDHDHETGSVRGVLCAPCNLMLGHASDDTDRLWAAIAYLEDHS